MEADVRMGDEEPDKLDRTNPGDLTDDAGGEVTLLMPNSFSKAS